MGAGESILTPSPKTHTQTLKEPQINAEKSLIVEATVYVRDVIINSPAANETG